VRPEADSARIFDGLRQESLASGRGAREYWERSIGASRRLLLAWEKRSGIVGFGRAIQVRLERAVAEFLSAMSPAMWGSTYAVRIDAAHPVPDIFTPDGTERVNAEVLFHGSRLGTLDLAVFDGVVPSRFLADQVAAEFAWPLLAAFFEHGVYKSIEVRQSASFVRNGVLLAEQTAPGTKLDFHEAVGWNVFLQELWGLPDWPVADFYDSQLRSAPPADEIRMGGTVCIEISRPLPDLLTDDPTVEVVALLGGLAVGVFPMEASAGRVTAQQVRAGIVGSTGFELCIRAVRDAILEKPLDQRPLRARLSDAAASVLDGSAIPFSEYFRKVPFAPPGASAIGRRRADAITAGAARRAVFPRHLSSLILETAAAEGRPIVPDGHLANVVYAPELVCEVQTRCVRQDTSGLFNQPTGPRQGLTAPDLPILMYHRVAPAGSAHLRQFRVDPEAFAAQIRYLADAGYNSITFDQWNAAATGHGSIPEASVILTFDDAYRDFQHYAWPILRRYGFSAYVFPVTGMAGGINRWDAGMEEIPLLSWDEILQLHESGVRFGSHTHTHQRLTSVSPADLIADLMMSREEFRRRLGYDAQVLSYPFDDHDRIVEHLAGACGFTYAVSGRPSLCHRRDPLLSLPRLEIAGSDDLATFVAKLTGGVGVRANRTAILSAVNV